MSAFSNTIQWFENPAFDKPELRSPQPCPRGVYCQYKVPNPETKELEIACCRMVHPGEEGNGRRLFPARTAADGRQQPACVRLTGNAGFYERCRLKQPWRVWAAAHEIPLPPTDIPWVQVTRGPIQRGSKTSIVYNEKQMDAFRGIAEYNETVGQQDAKEYRRRKAAGIPSPFDRLRQEESLNAAPHRWPSLQGSSGVKIAYEGSSEVTETEQNRLDEQQRRIDAAYAQDAVIHAILNPPPLNLIRQTNMSYGFSAAAAARDPAIPAPIYFTPQPPPRLDLRPYTNNYGFTPQYDTTALVYSPSEDGRATPSLVGSVNDEDTAPSFITRDNVIEEKINEICASGVNYCEARSSAIRLVGDMMSRQAKEGGMDEID